MIGLATRIATVGGIGYLRPAPGTWGSLIALPLAWVFHTIGGFPLLVLATISVCLIGIWAIHSMTVGQTDPDRSEIVVDEVAGQWVAVMAISYPAWAMPIDILRLWPGWLAAFCLFRLFDIWKPGPVGWADRRKDTIGVMLDDVLAGICAAAGVLILGGLWHWVLMK